MPVTTGLVQCGSCADHAGVYSTLSTAQRMSSTTFWTTQTSKQCLLLDLMLLGATFLSGRQPMANASRRVSVSATWHCCFMHNCYLPQQYYALTGYPTARCRILACGPQKCRAASLTALYWQGVFAHPAICNNRQPGTSVQSCHSNTPSPTECFHRCSITTSHGHCWSELQHQS